MTPSAENISENSRRIAKNTLLLYIRMLLLMVIGLFTTRLVVRALGLSDYGVYQALGGVVAIFTFITTSISSAISRFLAVEISSGTKERLRTIFSTSVIIQIALSVLIVLLVETAGMWLLHHKMDIPDGRMPAAEFVLHCSLAVLVINMLAVPFNATIIAHEKMSAFAWISILEAVLKLSVAFILLYGGYDKLKLYAVLMMVVALIVRLTYGSYCHRHFPESRGRLVYDASLTREMAGFAGWSFFGSSAYVFNTQGVTFLVNVFFGVLLNSARGMAAQVENIVKQFVSNILTAINPQITKSWASGDREYCFNLVSKGSKYSFIVILFFFIPFFWDAETLLHAWLGNVPAHAATFVRLTLLGLMVDLFGNSILTLMLATGHLRKYYLVTGLTSYLCLPLVWLLFRCGAAPEWGYIAFIIVYAVVLVERIWIVNKETGFPVGKYLALMGNMAIIGVLSMAIPWIVCRFVGPGWPRVFAVCATGWLSLALAVWTFALTDGEKAFIFQKVSPYLPDRIFLKWKYRLAIGRPLHLSDPERYTEKVQRMKLKDRNPLYHTLADKAEVKGYVESKIGAEYVIRTLGVWDRPEDIAWETLPEKFVLKCTHDSGSTIVCTDKASFDRKAAEEKLAAAQKVDFYRRDREWAYKGIRPRIIAEEYLGEDPADYKFFCFDGEPKFLFVATDRASKTEDTKFDFFDMEWNHLDVRNGHPNAAVPPLRPEGFEEMKSLAAKLSAGIPQVRVDLYYVDGKIYFGELTFYHWSGLVPFDPESADIQFGKMWK